MIERFKHARKGIIEGEIVRDEGEFVDIRLTSQVRLGFADPMMGEGFRSVHAASNSIIRVRKSILQPATDILQQEKYFGQQNDN